MSLRLCLNKLVLSRFYPCTPSVLDVWESNSLRYTYVAHSNKSKHLVRAGARDHSKLSGQASPAWVQVPTSGTWPDARRGHKAAITSSDVLWTFGGENGGGPGLS